MDRDYTRICDYLSSAARRQGSSPAAYLFAGSTAAGRGSLCQWFCDMLSPSAIIALDPGAEGSGLISVSDVRRVLSQISRTTFGGGRRLVLCCAADCLTQEAGNALLKYVEEPPAQTIFIFSAAHEDTLLPTLASRCTIIRLPVRQHTPTTDTLKQYGQWRAGLSVPLWQRMSLVNTSPGEGLEYNRIEEYIHQLLHEEHTEKGEQRAALSCAEQLRILYRFRSLAAARSASDRLILALP